MLPTPYRQEKTIKQTGPVANVSFLFKVCKKSETDSHALRLRNPRLSSALAPSQAVTSYSNAEAYPQLHHIICAKRSQTQHWLQISSLNQKKPKTLTALSDCHVIDTSYGLQQRQAREQAANKQTVHTHAAHSQTQHKQTNKPTKRYPPEKAIDKSEPNRTAQKQTPYYTEKHQPSPFQRRTTTATKTHLQTHKSLKGQHNEWRGTKGMNKWDHKNCEPPHHNRTFKKQAWSCTWHSWLQSVSNKFLFIYMYI